MQRFLPMAAYPNPVIVKGNNQVLAQSGNVSFVQCLNESLRPFRSVPLAGGGVSVLPLFYSLWSLCCVPCSSFPAIITARTHL